MESKDPVMLDERRERFLNIVGSRQRTSLRAKQSGILVDIIILEPKAIGSSEFVILRYLFYWILQAFSLQNDTFSVSKAVSCKSPFVAILVNPS